MKTYRCVRTSRRSVPIFLSDAHIFLHHPSCLDDRLVVLPIYLTSEIFLFSKLPSGKMTAVARHVLYGQCKSAENDLCAPPPYNNNNNNNTQSYNNKEKITFYKVWRVCARGFFFQTYNGLLQHTNARIYL